MQNTLILAATVIVAAVLMHPRLSRAPLWLATITPLASIIGSGFLVLGPILRNSYGLYAPGIMLVLCAVAYLFGGAIRFNMATMARDDRSKTHRRGAARNAVVLDARLRLRHLGRLLPQPVRRLRCQPHSGGRHGPRTAALQRRIRPDPADRLDCAASRRWNGWNRSRSASSFRSSRDCSPASSSTSRGRRRQMRGPSATPS